MSQLEPTRFTIHTADYLTTSVIALSRGAW